VKSPGPGPGASPLALRLVYLLVLLWAAWSWFGPEKR
jgi:hypothetical protein